MNAPVEAALSEELIEFRLNGEAVSARPDETIIEAAQRHAPGRELSRLRGRDQW
jgi:hypothetical protein